MEYNAEMPWSQDDIDAELGSLLGTLATIGGGIAGTAIGGPGIGTAIGASLGGGGGKLIGSVFRKGKKKKVVSISGRTQMTPSGRLVDDLSVSHTIQGATGTTPSSDTAITAGLANIQSSLARAEAQRLAVSAQEQDNKYHRKVISKLDTLNKICACQKPSTMRRFRAAFGI